jgi:hypothetical protein
VPGQRSSRSHLADLQLALDVGQRRDDRREHRGDDRRLDQPDDHVS